MSFRGKRRAIASTGKMNAMARLSGAENVKWFDTSFNAFAYSETGTQTTTGIQNMGSGLWYTMTNFRRISSIMNWVSMEIQGHTYHATSTTSSPGVARFIIYYDRSNQGSNTVPNPNIILTPTVPGGAGTVDSLSLQNHDYDTRFDLLFDKKQHVSPTVRSATDTITSANWWDSITTCTTVDYKRSMSGYFTTYLKQSGPTATADDLLLQACGVGAINTLFIGNANLRFTGLIRLIGIDGGGAQVATIGKRRK